jgi:hypothetical protein
MKYEIRPFVMLNDIEGIYEFANEDPSPAPFSVDTIRIGYPIIDYVKESYHDFPTTDGKPVASTASLLLEINALINKECDKGNNYAPHCKEDYCIEVVRIEDNIADVEIGS